MNTQQQLLTAIWQTESSVIANHNLDERGINIYRRNLFANAQRALSISFPTIFSLLDSDASAKLSQEFLRFSPPNQGDWTSWGAEFPKFLDQAVVTVNYLYLADCARLDWHIHCALHGIDQNFEQSSLKLLLDNDPEHIRVKFNQNVSLLNSPYPIIDIFEAHHHSDKNQREIAMAKAQQALSTNLVEQVVMVYRPGFQPKVKHVTASEVKFIHCLMAGKSLAYSLDTVTNDKDFIFEQWLITAIEQNLIYHFNEEQS